MSKLMDALSVIGYKNILVAILITVVGAATAIYMFREVLRALHPAQNARPNGKQGSAMGQTSKDCRPDAVILTSELSDLSNAEFDRLLELYFRDQAQAADGGSSDGVDMVIIDRYWHKEAIEQKLLAWGKWKPASERKK